MKTAPFILSITIPYVALAQITVPQTAPYTSDANTVLLDHFDGSTLGTPTGNVTYVPGMFGSAVHLDDSSYISYNISALPQGTIEFWGKLDTLTNSGSYGAQQFISSYYSPFFAGTGYIEVATPGSTVVNGPAGQSQAAINIAPFNWNGIDEPNPAADVVAGVWYDYALTWGSAGLNYYINGNLVYSNSNTGGQNPNTSWWAVGDDNGNGFNGDMDELRISNIQRTFAPTPEPNAYTMLIVGCAGILAFRRRRNSIA